MFSNEHFSRRLVFDILFKISKLVSAFLIYANLPYITLQIRFSENLISVLFLLPPLWYFSYKNTPNKSAIHFRWCNILHNSCYNKHRNKIPYFTCHQIITILGSSIIFVQNYKCVNKKCSLYFL